MGVWLYSNAPFNWASADRSTLYGWPVRVSTEGTCGVGCVWGSPTLVVFLGVVLVDCLEALWVAPSEVLGGRYCAAAWVVAPYYVCALWVG